MSYDPNYENPPDDPDTDDEYELMTDEERKLYDINEQIEYYETQINTIEDGYMFIWYKTIIPYLRISIGNGVLNKLSEGDGDKFFKFMLKSNVVYNNVMSKLNTLKHQKQKLIKDKPIENIKDINNNWKIIGKQKNKEPEKIEQKAKTLPNKNIWNNSSKALQDKWSGMA